MDADSALTTPGRRLRASERAGKSALCHATTCTLCPFISFLSSSSLCKSIGRVLGVPHPP